MPKPQSGPVCDYCHSGGLYLVTRDVPGAPAAQSCGGHLRTAVDKLAERAGAGQVDVYLLSGGTVLGGGSEGIEKILEHVRRVGAYSANDPATARVMEAELHRAVLALVAQGTVNPAGLAAAALMTGQYDLGRETE